MANILAKLNTILLQKAAISAAIEAKGISVNSAPLSSYADLISQINTSVNEDDINLSATTAIPSAVLSPYVFFKANGEEATGSIQSKGGETYIPGQEDQTISAGLYLAESQTILGDTNLTASNIKSGVTIFNVTGSYEGSGIDTSDANAVAGDLLLNKTAYVNSEKIIGTIQTVSPSTSNNVITIPQGYISSEQQITIGTAKSAQTYTPGTENQTITSGQYLTGDQTILGDTNLVPSSIVSGVTIFGVEGTYAEKATEFYKCGALETTGSNDEITVTGLTIQHHPEADFSEDLSVYNGTYQLYSEPDEYHKSYKKVNENRYLVLTHLMQPTSESMNEYPDDESKWTFDHWYKWGFQSISNIPEDTISTDFILALGRDNNSLPIGTNTWQSEVMYWIENQQVTISQAQHQSGWAGYKLSITSGGITYANQLTSGLIGNVEVGGIYSADGSQRIYENTLIPSNILSGVTIFGVSGNVTAGVDTSDANAIEGDLLQGKSAYVNGSKITGTITSKSAQTYTPGTTDQTITAGQYLNEAQTIKGDANLVPSSIVNGVTIFGVTGNYLGESNNSNTSETFYKCASISQGSQGNSYPDFIYVTAADAGFLVGQYNKQSDLINGKPYYQFNAEDIGAVCKIYYNNTENYWVLNYQYEEEGELMDYTPYHTNGTTFTTYWISEDESTSPFFFYSSYLVEGAGSSECNGVYEFDSIAWVDYGEIPNYRKQNTNHYLWYSEDDMSWVLSTGNGNADDESPGAETIFYEKNGIDNIISNSYNVEDGDSPAPSVSLNTASNSSSSTGWSGYQLTITSGGITYSNTLTTGLSGTVEIGGIYNEDATKRIYEDTLIPANIKVGTTILGVSGTMQGAIEFYKCTNVQTANGGQQLFSLQVTCSDNPDIEGNYVPVAESFSDENLWPIYSREANGHTYTISFNRDEEYTLMWVLKVDGDILYCCGTELFGEVDWDDPGNESSITIVTTKTAGVFPYECVVSGADISDINGTYTFDGEYFDEDCNPVFTKTVNGITYCIGYSLGIDNWVITTEENVGSDEQAIYMNGELFALWHKYDENLDDFVTTGCPTVTRSVVESSGPSVATWSGQRVILSGGIYTFEENITSGLIYSHVTPVINGIYSENALIKIESLYTGNN